jgi:hypothetical protein
MSEKKSFFEVLVVMLFGSGGIAALAFGQTGMIPYLHPVATTPAPAHHATCSPGAACSCGARAFGQTSCLADGSRTCVCPVMSSVELPPPKRTATTVVAPPPPSPEQAVAACCAALTQNARLAPEPTRTYTLQAAAVCNSAKAWNAPYPAVISAVSTALRGAGLPDKCL